MSQLKQILLNQTGYSAWATRQLLGACSDLAPEQLERNFGASHGGVVGTLCHFFDGERVWMKRLEERGEHRLPAGTPPAFSFEEMMQAWPEIWLSYQNWIEAAADADLIGEVSTILPNGITLMSTRWQLILHVVTHSTMHRGQIVSMLRELGVKPPDTDDLTYYHENSLKR